MGKKGLSDCFAGWARWLGRLKLDNAVLPSRFSLYVAVAVIVAISGAALAWDGPTDTVGTAAAAMAEYRSEAGKLRLAPGWHWPARPALTGVGADGEREGYGKGFGAILADAHWFCSWASRAVSPLLSPKARRDALAQLPKIRNTPSYKALIPDTRAYEDAMIAQALRGNASTLREYVTANCVSR